MFYTLILENETGQQIDLSKTANRYMFSKIKGLNPPTGTVSTSSYAGMNGSYLNNAFIEKRNVVIPFEMRGFDVELRRHELYRVVKPSRYIKIYYSTKNISVYAEGIVETCEVENFEKLTNGQISILCPDIYWYSTETQIAEYSRVRGAFHFVCPDNDEPFPIGIYNTQDMMTINNSGDEVGFTFEISGGPAKNPTIYNALTDEYMQISGDIQKGDVITITTKTGNKTVLLEREGVVTNIINRLVSGSTWLNLKTGENKFYVRASDGLNNIKVRLIHRNAYLGVWEMQIEIYNMAVLNDKLNISLEAVCDSFSSLLWDIEYYKCGAFEVYIAASPRNIEIFQTGRIVGRDDDMEHYGLIESVQLETDAEDGDYLIVRGRFLMCLLERRIIYPTVNFTKETSYSDIIKTVVQFNAVVSGARKIPGLSVGTATGSCWEQKTKLQISYDNLMRWVYTICEKIGGTANIRLSKTSNEQYEMIFELSQGADRSILQEENPHIIFSDRYNNLLSFTYFTDTSVKKNYAYVLGKGEGEKRKRTIYFEGTEPSSLDRYEVYVDAKDISDEEQENGETKPLSEKEYAELLKEKGKQNLVPITMKSESQIAVQSTQFQYGVDYFVGDFVTAEHHRFGIRQNKIQLVGMIESFDRNGRNLTPTFKEME